MTVEYFAAPGFVPSTVMESAWHWALLTLGDGRLLFASMYALIIVCYLACGGVFFLMEQLRLFPSYRLQPGKWPTSAEYVACLKNLFLNYTLVILPLVLVAPGAIALMGRFSYGISLWGELPSVGRFAAELMFQMVMEDVFQYVLHRALHLPSLYPRVHKVHHQFKTPFGLAASYAHWFEVLTLSICTFAGPFFLMFVPGYHHASFFAWILFRQLDAVRTHCGWASPVWLDPLALIPTYESTVMHDYHHVTFLYNYASRFAFLDKLCGTYKEPYDPIKEMAKETKKAA